MKTKCLIVLSLFYSFSAFSAVSIAEKRERVQELIELSKELPMINFEAYQRTLSYEEEGLTLNERTDKEKDLFVERVRNQIIEAFDSAYEELGNVNLAREQVLSAIEDDLNSADSDYRSELRELAIRTLDSLVMGSNAIDLPLVKIEKNIRKQLKNKSDYLNEEPEKTFLKMNSLMSTDRSKYNSKSSLISSLVSDKNSDMDFSGATNVVNTAISLKSETNISLQVKMEFLGASLEAGPTIVFKREIATNATIRAEGLHPIINRDGSFDFYKRDSNNNIVKRNGKAQRRTVNFNCNTAMIFESDYSGGGGFKYMGVGADVTFSTKFKNTVELNSRSVQLPDVIGNQTTNVKVISDLCHKDFLGAKINSQMTVAKSLDTMMRNVASGLVFSHSKTTCSRNSDCNSWFNKQPAVKRASTVGRCVQHKEEKYQFCQLRAKVNQSCPLYSKGKLITSGINENPCDWGLKCVQIEPAYYILGFEWSPAVGRCQRK